MLVWLDLETTGLDPERDAILEIGVIVTNDALEEIGRFHRVFPAEEWIFPGLHPAVQKMHTENGLWELCVSRNNTIDWGTAMELVETELIDFLKSLGIEPKTAQLAGSTISFDRSFLAVDMPQLNEFLHYRNLDVTTLNEIARRFWPDVHANRPTNGEAHRAMSDIALSLEVAKYYTRVLTPCSYDEI